MKLIIDNIIDDLVAAGVIPKVGKQHDFNSNKYAEKRYVTPRKRRKKEEIDGDKRISRKIKENC